MRMYKCENTSRFPSQIQMTFNPPVIFILLMFLSIVGASNPFYQCTDSEQQETTSYDSGSYTKFRKTAGKRNGYEGPRISFFKQHSFIYCLWVRISKIEDEKNQTSLDQKTIQKKSVENKNEEKISKDFMRRLMQISG